MKCWQAAIVLALLGVTSCRPLKEGDLAPDSCYPAGSKIEDKAAFGGFGPSDNFPRPRGDEPLGEEGKVALVASTDGEGLRLRLVNRTEQVVAFDACNSCLFLVQEAQTSTGEWRPVEKVPTSWCGNSYHRVFLEPDEYWEVAAPRSRGSLKTKLRFRLEATEHGAAPLYSNEFEGSVNLRQFVARADRG